MVGFCAYDSVIALVGLETAGFGSEEDSFSDFMMQHSVESSMEKLKDCLLISRVHRLVYKFLVN